MDRDDLLKLVHSFLKQGVSLNFSGKRTAQIIQRKVRPRVTQQVKALHVGSEEDQERNMLIEGENLQAMVTLHRFKGEVDLILTDPPYNTGQDFRYNDKWDEDPNDPELGHLVTKEDGSRHTKWMKFMLPRLYQMKDMLSEHGVIAICIDDNELFHLGMMMDEVFEESNRLGVINWQKAYAPKNGSKHISTATEYILVYAKNKAVTRTALEARTESMDGKYSTPDSDPLEWKSGDPTGPGEKTHRKMVYAIQSPFTGVLYYPSKGRHWANEKKTMREWLEAWGSEYQEMWIEDGNEIQEKGKGKAVQIKALVLKGTKFSKGELISGEEIVKTSREKAKLRLEKGSWPPLYFGLQGETGPQQKQYLNEVKRGKIALTYWADEDYDAPFELGFQSWDHQESGHSQTGINELNSIIGKGHGFETVKPLRLMQKIIQLWCPPKGLVLDPFAGSGTTGHAVLDLNHQSGSERRFILIEQGRPTKGDKYARSLTHNRLKRVIEGVRVEKVSGEDSSTQPLGSGFSFYQLTQRVDAKALLSMRREELIDVVLASHFDSDRKKTAGLIRIDSPASKNKYLFGKNDRGEGYFMIWQDAETVGHLDEDTYDIVLEESKKAGLKPPHHIYARYEILQSPNVRFYQIPDRILMHLGFNEFSDSFNNEDESEDTGTA